MSRPMYQEYLRLNSHEKELFSDFGLTLGCLITIIIVRVLFNTVLYSRASRLLARRSVNTQPKDVWKLLEEMWVTVANTVIVSWSMYVMLEENGGCWFLSTHSCFTGWPFHPVSPAVRLYYNAELAWYCHLLLKPVLRYGMPDGAAMLVHHCCTLALVLLSYGLGFVRIGVLVLCLFNLSNPFLHAAKILNQLSLPIRIPAFGLFGAVFAVTRVGLVPVSILHTTLWDVWNQIPGVASDFFGSYTLLNVLLVALYGLQVMWMWGIIRVLRQAFTQGSEAASKLSSDLDPSQRYSAAAAAAGEGERQNGRRSPSEKDS